MTADIRKEIAKLLRDEYQISEDITAALFERRILFAPAIRNALIREEYMRKIRPKEKNLLKAKLADRYCVSFASIEKILAN